MRALKVGNLSVFKLRYNTECLLAVSEELKA